MLAAESEKHTLMGAAMIMADAPRVSEMDLEETKPLCWLCGGDKSADVYARSNQRHAHRHPVMGEC